MADLVETRVSGRGKEVIISHQRPTVLIGERINPTGKKNLADAFQSGDLEFVRAEALAQVQAGADILDINVGVPGMDEVSLLPEVVQVVSEVVDVPLCLDSGSPKALEAGLRVCQGKALVNSVSGKESSLAEVLPLIKEHGAAVIGLTMDDTGVPDSIEQRLTIAHKIVERAGALGIPIEDVVIDCLVTAVGADSKAGLATLGAVHRVKEELGVNMTMGASNISFGMPDRDLLNTTFLAIAIAAGVNCPVVDAAKARPLVLAADVILDRDLYAKRYTGAYRQRRK